MLKYFVFVLASIACCWTSLPATAQEDSSVRQCPPENPPQILVASSIDSDGQLVLVSYHSIFIGFTGESYNERLTMRVSLEDVQILTVDGKTVALEEARKRISERDTPILVTSYKTQLPEFYVPMFAPETLLFVFASQAPQWKDIESPGAPVEK